MDEERPKSEMSGLQEFMGSPLPKGALASRQRLTAEERRMVRIVAYGVALGQLLIGLLGLVGLGIWALASFGAGP